MHRFRFAHQPEDADEVADMIVPVRCGRWDCAVCREENSLDDSHCGWCKNANGDWVCNCGHLNPSGAVACQTCGRAKG